MIEKHLLRSAIFVRLLYSEGIFQLSPLQGISSQWIKSITNVRFKTSPNPTQLPLEKPKTASRSKHSHYKILHTTNCSHRKAFYKQLMGDLFFFSAPPSGQNTWAPVPRAQPHPPSPSLGL